jgi:hypothetical protein
VEGLWILAIVWAALSFFGRLSQQRRDQQGSPPLPEPGPKRHQPRQREPRHRVARSEPVDQEAPEDEWRREIERLLGVRTGAEYGPVGRTARERLPEAEDVEERGSLEEEREVVSLETLDDRASRSVTDFDDEAQAVLEQRLAVAEARTTGRTLQDHRRFDQTIRAPAPTAPPAVRKRPPLRQALVWREVLGPPVSLRSPGVSD